MQAQVACSEKGGAQEKNSTDSFNLLVVMCCSVLLRLACGSVLHCVCSILKKQLYTYELQ